MFSFLCRPKQPMGEVQITPPGTNMLCFDPPGVVRVIAFHLLDEGKARAINIQSSQVAVIKLARRIVRLTISTDQWARMENGQRLQWLLIQSRIVVRSAASGTAMLSVR